MKAVTLLVELKRDRNACEDEIAFLMSKLPACGERVIYGARMLGFLMPARDILPALRAPLHNALSVFENYWFIGMSGEVLAKNGSLDPLASAIKQYVVPPRPKSPANENRGRDQRSSMRRSVG
jgi:hypothetical protein